VTLNNSSSFDALQLITVPSDKDWKGSSYNVLVEWEKGETTYEPLQVIAADDPITCAEYAKENNILDTDGWKQF
jgi:hypothetical protein